MTIDEVYKEALSSQDWSNGIQLLLKVSPMAEEVAADLKSRSALSTDAVVRHPTVRLVLEQLVHLHGGLTLNDPQNTYAAALAEVRERVEALDRVPKVSKMVNSREFEQTGRYRWSETFNGFYVTDTLLPEGHPGKTMGMGDGVDMFCEALEEGQDGPPECLVVGTQRFYDALNSYFEHEQQEVENEYFGKA